MLPKQLLVHQSVKNIRVKYIDPTRDDDIHEIRFNLNDPKLQKSKDDNDENIKRQEAELRAFTSLLVRAHNLPLVLSAISSIVSHEKNVEAPCPTYENIIQECSDSEFGIENVEFNPANPNDTSVNVALDPNGLLRAGTHIKILEYITSHTPMKEKDDIFLESTEEFETRCFLHIYKELKTPDGNKLDADSLLRLLKQRNIHQIISISFEKRQPW